MGHAPVSAKAFTRSVLALTNESVDLEGFVEGYESWHSAFTDGNAGIFTITLAEIVEYMEQALNQ